VVHEYEYDSANDVWKITVYLKLTANTDIYNYDEGGSTTGLGIRVDTGPWNEDENHDIQDSYYGFNPSTGAWESLTFASSGYTWRTGYRATRITIVVFGDTIHIYTKYITKGGSISLSTYKHARDASHAWLNHYYNEFADKTISQGNTIAYAVEMWHAKTDVYEDPVPAETDYGTSTSFIDNYFKISTTLTLQITQL